MDQAFEMRKRSWGHFVRFNSTYEKDTMDAWEKMVTDWDSDKTNPNPYEEPKTGQDFLQLSFVPFSFCTTARYYYDYGSTGAHKRGSNCS
jgi:hypothetical protein